MSTETSTTTWDQTVDVLVVGSGAGALTAALTAYDRGASPLIIEKGPQYGGASAMSGGGLWVPNNHLMAGVGIQDTPEDAWKYMKGCVGDAVADDRQRAYLENAPQMVKYLMEHSRVKFVALPEYADYYPNIPGSRPGGRCLEGERFHARELGNDEFVKMRESALQSLISCRIFMSIFEARLLMTRSPGWLKAAAKLMARYWLDLPWRLKSKRDRSMTMGNALVGMLRRSLMDRGVPLWLNTPARELIMENGCVVGVVAEREGRKIRIRANKGVIIGSGGFEQSQAKREKYLPNPTRTEWSCANKYNTGDAVDMGLAVGAALDLMDDAWWGPTCIVPGEEYARMLVIEKSLPGSIFVNKRGIRFVNEASAYIDVVKAMYKNHTPESPCVPCYLVFDATFRKKYPVGPFLPGQQQPDSRVPKDVLAMFKKADTLDAVAAQAGVDPAGLKATIAKFNEYARTGTDADFHRGETVFDKYYGDPMVQPNPCLAPIETPPFYILEAYPGELGTKGGLKTDARARVLNEAGQPIPGLYATGNCSASVMGHTYPGAGSTIGPTMTFGYVAARDVTEK
jgi:3-oxosteroid 1-dehydrogenase